MSELNGIGERYRLDGLVVSDGAGSVFRGTDTRSGEPVSVELVHDEIREGDVEARERFLETARALQSLDHPGLPIVLDFGFTGSGNPFLVTDHVHGPSLEDLAGAAPGRLLSLLLVLADGLEALARRGIAVPALSPGDVLVVPGETGERIRLRGLGRAVSGEEGGRATLRAFALLAAGVLRISPNEVGIPLELAVELNDPEALRELLKAGFRGDPEERYASFREVRKALTQAFLGIADREAAVSAETRPDLRTLVTPEAPEKDFDHRTRAFDSVSSLEEPTEWKTQVFVPPPPPPVPSVPAIAEPAPAPPPPLPPPAARPQRRLLILAGAAAVILAGASYLLGRHAAEGPPAPAPAVRPGPAVPVPAASQGPAVPQPVPEAPTPLPPEELANDQARARKEAEVRRARAEQREKAAAALESEAEEAIAAGQFDLALSRLQSLRQGWPEREGIDERIERARAERKEDLELEAVLAAAIRAERANQPLEGLEELAGARPNRRLAPRFEQTRGRLENLLAELDRRPPELSLRGGSEVVYDKGKPARLPLRITDDHAVKSAEGWARAEGGRFERVAVRQVSGADYEVEVSPELHGNKTVEVYVVASDHSGHAGQLGSADRPLKIKRKRWIDRVLGGKEPGP